MPARAQAGAARVFDIGLVTTKDGFLALREEWDDLFARAALPHNVFQSHVFLRHWAEHYLDAGTSLRIVTGRRDGRLAMVWPLVAQRRLGFQSLRFMGVPVAQFGDVLAEPDSEALLAAGWKRVCGLGADLFEARKLRAESVLGRAGLLREAKPLDRLEAPFADLATRIGPDGPGAVYPARERSNHRRRLRRLAERGAITFAVLPPGPDAARLATEAVAMKQVALDRHGIAAPTVADPRFSAFFAALAGDAAGDSPLRTSVITCDGSPIGIDLSLDCKGVTFGHVIATHPEHERGGVGRILAYHAFAGAKVRGNATFDLLAPADAYKLDHADGSTPVADLVLPLSLAGRTVCGLGLLSLRPAVKAAAQRLPPALARRIAAWGRGAKG